MTKLKSGFVIFFLLISFQGFTLSTPNVSSPQDNATVQAFSAYLSLMSVTGATGYQFYLDTVPTLNSGWRIDKHELYTGSGSPELKVGKSYWWKARAYKPGDTSAWTATLKFTTSMPVMSFIEPASGTTGNVKSFSGIISGLTDSTYFQFEADTNATYNSPLHTLTTYRGFKNFQDSTLFDFGRKIYWRMRAWNKFGDSTPWTTTRNYTIIKQAILNGSTNITIVDPVYYPGWTNTYLAQTVVQVDTTPNFDSFRLTEYYSGPNSTFDTIANLPFGKMFYIRARNLYGGKVSGWSATRVIQVTANTVFLEPSFNGETNYPFYGSCQWTSMKGVLSQFGIFEDAAYTIPVVDTITDKYIYYGHKFLKLKQRYYVKLRVYHAADTAPWLYSSFVVTDARQGFSGITHQGTNISVRPHIYFKKPAYATQFYIEIDTGTSYSEIHSPYYIFIDSFKYDGSYYHYLDTSLLYNQNYVARFYAITLTGDTTGYSIYLFKTANAPVNYFPQNNYIGLGTSSNGLVTGVNGSTFIQWAVDTSISFSSPMLQVGTDPHIPDDFTPQYVGLEFPDYFKFHTTYYWRARCINPIDTGDWSQPFRFLTTQEIWCVAPLTGTTVPNLTPTLEWGIQGSSSELRYQYMLSTDSNFTGATIVNMHADSPSRAKVTCQFSQKYYWKARAINPIDTSHWSATFNFSTLPPPPVGVPVLLSPVNGLINVPVGPITLSWNYAANAVTYDVQVAVDAGFTDIAASGSTASTGIYFSGAQPFTRYYWRVRGVYNASHMGNWSNSFWFRTAPGTGMNDLSKKESATIYPNPASTSITVKSPGTYEVQITNPEGRVIWTGKGNEEVSIPVQDFVNGVYFVTILSAETYSTQQLVIAH